MTTKCHFAVTSVLLLILVAHAIAADAKKPEELAKDAALRFAKAFNDRSVDGMMDVAGVPFFYRPKGTPMGSTFAPSPVVKTAKELRAKLQEKIAGSLPTDTDRVVK